MNYSEKKWIKDQLVEAVKKLVLEGNQYGHKVVIYYPTLPARSIKRHWFVLAEDIFWQEENKLDKNEKVHPFQKI